jgi:hypothetical protein
MLRKALFVIAFATLACGSQETTTTTPAAGGMGAIETETPPVSAVQPTPAAPTPTVEAVSCLELVDAGKYAEAVVICQTAATQDPSNTSVAAALAKAGAATAAEGAVGAAAAAAGNAGQAVTDAAAGAAAATGDAIDAAAETAKDAVGADEEKATQ